MHEQSWLLSEQWTKQLKKQYIIWKLRQELSERGTMGHQGKWELASPYSYHKHFPSSCCLVWNLQPQAFKSLMLLPDILDLFPQPTLFSFVCQSRVEYFSGSLALLYGFLADSPPSLSGLQPSLLPLAAFRARVCWREEVIYLPSQPPFVVRIRTWRNSFNSSAISLKISSKGLQRFTFMVCICAKDPQ